MYDKEGSMVYQEGDDSSMSSDSSPSPSLLSKYEEHYVQVPGASGCSYHPVGP